jgi:hypothetical protein
MAVDVHHRGRGSTTQAAALSDPASHRFVPGTGYVRYAASPKVIPGLHPVGRATPPANTLNGSPHLLISPGGGVAMAFTWVVKPGAWARPGGLRMAFAADYLSRAGWVYVGPVQPKEG